MSRLSVVLPIHNGRPFLDAAVRSILGQSFTDFELVILDNGSTDGSGDRAAWWAERDARVRVQRIADRLGGAGSSRAVVELTSSELIARMDADDVSHPRRLERQMAAFARRPDAVMVATLHEYLDSTGRRTRGLDRWPALRGRAEMPFTHSSMMFRRDAYDQVGGYRRVNGTWEDLDLSRRLAALGPVLIVPEALCAVRFRALSRSARVSAARAQQAARARSDGDDPRSDDALALFELAAIQLWAGGRPRRLRELAHAAARCQTRTAGPLLAWSVWAAASPASLRAALRVRSWARDRVAACRLPEGSLVPWRIG